MRKAIITIILLCFYLSNTNAQTKSKIKWSMEIDPIPFALNGYSFHGRIAPLNEHLNIGLSFFAFDVPTVLSEVNRKNKGKGWDLKLTSGIAGFIEYHFNEVNHGPFISLELGSQSYSISNNNFDGRANYTLGVVQFSGGYTIPLFGDHFYLKPWGGIGISPKIYGNSKVQEMNYELSPFIFLATFHLGYNF